MIEYVELIFAILMCAFIGLISASVAVMVISDIKVFNLWRATRTPSEGPTETEQSKAKKEPNGNPTRCKLANRSLAKHNLSSS